jgi:glycerol kinase
MGGELAAGTVDTYVIWHLTGGREHLTDQTNASRTLLMDLQSGQWADELCDVFEVPAGILASIRPSSGEFGCTRGLSYLPDGIPIMGVAGDQQASLVGQGCVQQGHAKCTYGTGAFLLAHTGPQLIASKQGLITTRAATLGDEPPQYALEGSVFIAGAAVQWFRDGLEAIGSAPEIDEMSIHADPTSGVTFVPALTGLGAPHWEPAARGTLFGLTRATSLADVARATLEGVAFQIADLIEAIQEDLESPLTELRIDGGMARSDPFLQFQADILGQPIRRSPQTESTALGAALLAGLGVGLWPNREFALELLQSGGQTFLPQRDFAWRARVMERWRRAVETVIRHYRKESAEAF